MSAPENNASLLAAEQLSSLAPASPTMASKNDAGENVDDSNKEQATGQPNKEIVGKSSGSGEGNESTVINGKEELSTIPDLNTREK